MKKKSLLTATLCYFLILCLPATVLAQAKTTTKPTTTIVYGKYGCTASKYRNGFYEFIPRGSFTISQKGQYTYYGFEKPSSGSFTVDKDENLLFKGGYFNGGKAEKTDRPDKYFLVFPANPDNRWSCTLVRSK